MEKLTYSWWADAKEKLIVLTNQYPLSMDVVCSIWKNNNLDFEKTEADLQLRVQKGY